jgi:Tol biopolymer transport system component
VLGTSRSEHAGSWVAGGPRLIYLTTRADEIRLYSTVEGTDRPLVTLPPGGFMVGAVPSPDGQRIAYAEIRPRTGLWIVPTTGGEPTRVSTDQNLEFGGAWSPDSRRLASYRNDGGVMILRIRRLGSSDPPVDLPMPPSQDAGSVPEWSPDASWIALCQQHGILLMDVAGATRREIAKDRECRALQWSRDGRTIFAPVTTASNDTILVAIDVARDTAREISRLPHGVGVGTPLTPSLRLSLNASGTALLTTVVHSNTDIWTLDDFDR